MAVAATSSRPGAGRRGSVDDTLGSPPGGAPPQVRAAAETLRADRSRVLAARRLRPQEKGSTGLDRLAELAARLLGTPAAQVSLLDEVQVVAAATGLPPGAADGETA